VRKFPAEKIGSGISSLVPHLRAAAAQLRAIWKPATALLALAVISGAVLSLLLMALVRPIIGTHASPVDGSNLLRSMIESQAPIVIVGLLASAFWAISVIRLVQLSQSGTPPTIGDAARVGLKRLFPTALSFAVSGSVIAAITIGYPVVLLAAVTALLLTPLVRLAGRFGGSPIVWPSVRLLLVLLVPLVPGIILTLRWALVLPEIAREGTTTRQALSGSRQRVEGRSFEVALVLITAGVFVGAFELLVVFVVSLLNPDDGLIALAQLAVQALIGAFPLVAAALLSGTDGVTPPPNGPSPTPSRSPLLRWTAQAVCFSLILQSVVFANPDPAGAVAGGSTSAITMTTPGLQADAGTISFTFQIAAAPIFPAVNAPSGEPSFYLYQCPAGYPDCEQPSTANPVPTTQPCVGVDKCTEWTFEVPNVLAGDWLTKVVYLGDSVYDVEYSEVFELSVVSLTDTSITAVDTNPQPSVVGQTVQVKATIDPIVEDGIVQFASSRSGPIGQAAIDASGFATLDTSALERGSHTITASFAQQGGYRESTGTAAHVVNELPTTLTIDLDQTSPTNAGSPLVATINVVSTVPSSASVNGSASLSTAVTNSSGVSFRTLTNSISIANGVGQITLTDLVPGSHVFSATFYGGSDYDSSTNTSAAHVVEKALSNTSLATSPTGTVFGQPFDLTATINGPAAFNLTGSVGFFDGTTSLGTAMVVGGSATITSSGLPIGSRSLTARYSGDDIFEPSVSTATPHVVSKNGVVVNVTASPVAITVDDDTVIVVTVSAAPPGTGVPSGNVTLTENGAAVSPTLALGPSGQASATVTLTEDRAYAFVASYEGDSQFLASSGVGGAIASTEVTSATLSSPQGGQSTFGEAVTFDVWVRSSSGSATGWVDLRGPSGVIASSQLDGTGNAQFTIDSLESRLTGGASGINYMSVIYRGDGRFRSGVSNTLEHRVAQAETSIGLIPASSVATLPVTLQATVSEAGGTTPTGDVTFVSNGSVTLGVATLNGGVATLTTTLLTDVRTLSAVYPGGPNHLPSTVIQLARVRPVLSITSLSTSSPTPELGQVVVLNARAATSGRTIPSGSVTLKDGATTLETAGLVNGSAQFSVCVGPSIVCPTAMPIIDIRTHNFVASYGGDPNFIGSDSTPLVVDASAAKTTVTVATPADPVLAGDLIRLVATVTADNSLETPRGQVFFFAQAENGLTPIATVDLNLGGQAHFIARAGVDFSVTTTGIVVHFSPDPGFAASQGETPQTVVKRSATLAFSPISSARVGETIAVRVRVTRVVGGQSPSGTVIITEGTGQSCSAPIAVNGTASCSLSFSAAGEVTLTASWSGDAFYAAPESTNQQVVVRRGIPSITITTDSVWVTNEPIVLDYKVDGPTGGTVRVTDHGSGLTECASQRIAGSCTVNYATAGVRQLVVAYSGDQNWEPANSGVSQTVQKCYTDAFATEPSSAGVVTSYTPTNCNGGTGWLSGTDLRLGAKSTSNLLFRDWFHGPTDVYIDYIIGVDGQLAVAYFDRPCQLLTLDVTSDWRRLGQLTVDPAPNCGDDRFNDVLNGDGTFIGRPHDRNSASRPVSGWYRTGTSVQITGISGFDDYHNTDVVLQEVNSSPVRTGTFSVSIDDTTTVSARFGLPCSHFRLGANVEATSAPTCEDFYGEGWTVATPPTFQRIGSGQVLVESWMVDGSIQTETGATLRLVPSADGQDYMVSVELIKCSAVQVAVDNPGGWPVRVTLPDHEPGYRCGELGPNFFDSAERVEISTEPTGPAWQADGTVATSWTNAAGQTNCRGENIWSPVPPRMQQAEQSLLDRFWGECPGANRPGTLISWHTTNDQFSGDVNIDVTVGFPSDTITVELKNTLYCSLGPIEFFDAQGDDQYSWSQTGSRCPTGTVDGRVPIDLVGTPTSDVGLLAFAGFADNSPQWRRALQVAATTTVEGAERHGTMAPVGRAAGQTRTRISVFHCQEIDFSGRLILDNGDAILLDTESARAFFRMDIDPADQCPGDWGVRKLAIMGSAATLHALGDPEQFELRDWTGDVTGSAYNATVEFTNPRLRSISVSGTVAVICHTVSVNGGFTSPQELAQYQADNDSDDIFKIALTAYPSPTRSGSEPSCIGPRLGAGDRFMGGDTVALQRLGCGSDYTWVRWDGGPTGNDSITWRAPADNEGEWSSASNWQGLTLNTSLILQVNGDVALNPFCRKLGVGELIVDAFEEIGDALAVFAKKAFGVITVAVTNLLVNWPPIGAIVSGIGALAGAISWIATSLGASADSGFIKAMNGVSQTIGVFENMANCVGEWALSDNTPASSPPPAPAITASSPVEPLDLAMIAARNAIRQPSVSWIALQFPDGTIVNDPQVIADLAPDLELLLQEALEAQGGAVNAEWQEVVITINAQTEEAEEAGPASRPRYKGLWVPNQPYSKGDLVDHEGHRYEAMVDSPKVSGSETPAANRSQWQRQPIGAISVLGALTKLNGAAVKIANGFIVLSNSNAPKLLTPAKRAEAVVKAAVEGLTGIGRSAGVLGAAAPAVDLVQDATDAIHDARVARGLLGDSTDEALRAASREADEAMEKAVNEMTESLAKPPAKPSALKAAASKAIGPGIAVGSLFATMGAAETLGWEGTAADAWRLTDDFNDCATGVVPDWVHEVS
jgi:hypothetical protein